MTTLSKPITVYPPPPLPDGEDVSTWDDEELFRGRRRAVDGSFRGREPRVLPREVHLELQRRMLMDGATKLRRMVLPALTPLRQTCSRRRRGESGRLGTPTWQYTPRVEHMFGKSNA